MWPALGRRVPARYRDLVTTDDVIRTEPARLGDERSMLVAWVDYYRATLLYKCAGLTPEQLVSQPCPPSDMSLAGLVRHMTEMERAYAHRLAEPGVQLLYCTDDSPDGDFEGATAEEATKDLEVYVAHCERSREVMAAHGLDDEFGRVDHYSLRWVYLYLIKEYARHLGHADLLREAIDGSVGE